MIRASSYVRIKSWLARILAHAALYRLESVQRICHHLSPYPHLHLGRCITLGGNRQLAFAGIEHHGCLGRPSFAHRVSVFQGPASISGCSGDAPYIGVICGTHLTNQLLGPRFPKTLINACGPRCRRPWRRLMRAGP